MKHYSWFPFYFERFLIGTSDMNDREVGIYIRLLILQYDKGGVPKDHRGLKVDRVRAKFTLEVDGLLLNPTMDEVKNSQQKTTARLRESGLKGNQKRWGGDGVAIAVPSGGDRKGEKIRIEKNRENQDLYVGYINLLNKILGRKYKGDAKSKRQFEARIGEGYVLEDFNVAVTSASQDDYHRNQCQPQYKYLTPEFFSRQDKLEMFVNRGPKVVQVNKTNGVDLKGYSKEQIIDLVFIKPEDMGYIMTIRPSILKERDSGIKA